MPSPELPSGNHPFGLDVYRLAGLVMHEPLAAIARPNISQTDLDGLRIARAHVVELNLKGSEMEEQRSIVYWPSDDALYMLIPRRSGVGRT